MVGQEGSSRIESDRQRLGSLTLLYVDLLQRMISQTIRLIDAPAPRPHLSRTPSLSGVIGLPNPLKALIATHSEAPNKTESTEAVGRIEVGAQVELGVVPLDGTIMANRSVPTNDGRRTIFWTESGLTVGTTVHDNWHPLTRFRLSKYSPAALGKFGQLRCLPSTLDGSIRVRLC